MEGASCEHSALYTIHYAHFVAVWAAAAENEPLQGKGVVNRRGCQCKGGERITREGKGGRGGREDGEG